MWRKLDSSQTSLKNFRSRWEQEPRDKDIANIMSQKHYWRTINITDAHHQYYFCLPPAAAAILSAHFHWDAEPSSLQNLTPHCPIALLNSLQLPHT